MPEVDHVDDGIVYYSDGSYMFEEAGTRYDAQGNPIEQGGEAEGTPESGSAETSESGEVPEAASGEPEEGAIRLDEPAEQPGVEQQEQQSENQAESQAHEPAENSVVVLRYDNQGNYEGFYEIDEESVNVLGAHLGVVSDGSGVGVHVDSAQFEVVNSSAVLVPIILFAVLGAIAIRTLFRSFE